MRRRAIQMVSLSVAVAVIFLGIPLIILGILNIQGSAEQRVMARTSAIATVISRRVELDQPVTSQVLAGYQYLSDSEPLYIECHLPDGAVVAAGKKPVDPANTITATDALPDGGDVKVWLDAGKMTQTMIGFGCFATLLIFAAFGIGVLVALRQSRRISAPLIYLAASAEQLGAAQVRPKVKPSGIEEIDLVNQELERTADRLAGRIAAERQFAAAAAHQLRTPLTALSMRLEEIQYLAEDPQIAREAEIGLEQIERLGGVINELMANAKKAAHGNNEALSIDDIFHQQKDEWERTFAHAGRKIKFMIETDAIVLATASSLAQILATLIENSLKYGAGLTSVRATKSASMIVIRVKDEGQGISAELAPLIFMRGVSAGGSSGIGLPVAKELAENIGGRLELTNREEAEFTLTMRSMPASFDPSRLMPQGAAYTVGARRHRR